MSVKKISQLNPLTSNEVTSSIDLLAIVDTTNTETKKITVDNLLSGGNYSVSGSFSGSFQGDGSGITGVTGEWDGSHNGNASITGSLTVTGIISSSSNLFGDRIAAAAYIQTPVVNSATNVVRIDDNLNVVGQITASGDISSSADVYGITGSFLHLLGDGSQLTGVESEWDGTLNGNGEITGSLIVTGDITGSNISASGNLYMNQTPGTDNSVVVLDSTGKLVTDEIDSRVWGSTLANLSNGVDNRVVTSTDANSLNGEANMTFNGNTLGITGNIITSADIESGDDIIANGTSAAVGTGASLANFTLGYTSTGTPIANITRQGGDVVNQQQGQMTLYDRTLAPLGPTSFYATTRIVANSISTLGGVNGGLHIGESFNANSSSHQSRQLWLDEDQAYKPTDDVWTITSDQRLKENITTASLDICYDVVKNLPLKRYTYKESTFKLKQVNDRTQLGWIAQEVQPILPKSVTTGSFTTWATYTGSRAIPGSTSGSILEPGKTYQDPLAGSIFYDDSLSLSTSQLNKMLYGAVQKLMQKVEALEAIITGSV